MDRNWQGSIAALAKLRWFNVLVAPVLILTVLAGTGGEASADPPLLVQAAGANPPGTTVDQIRQRYSGQTGVVLSQWAPGMYALMFGQTQGRPTYYFCHDELVTYAYLIEGADIIMFRRLVAGHQSLFGTASYKLEGAIDSSGAEWASVDASWTINGRNLELDLRQYAGNPPLVQVSVKDRNSCLDRAQLGW